MDNKEIAALLNDIAVYKELAGENPFKARALYQAARTIEMYPDNLYDLMKKDAFPKIKGVGETIQEIIREWVMTGMSEELEKLKEVVPDGLIEMLKLQGVGPKKVKAIHDKLGITTIGELEYACRENRLALLDGFGVKSQANILKSIEFLKTNKGNFLYYEARVIVEGIFSLLESNKSIYKYTLAGSLRRGKKTVKDADILVVPKEGVPGEEAAGYLKSLGEEIIAAGPTKLSCRINGLQVDFRIIEEKSYPAAIQYFTGSKVHNTQLRGIAKDMGLKLNEYGLYRGEDPLPLAGEEDVYKNLGLEYIEPELREGDGEIEAARDKSLPDILEEKDIRSMIHVHSKYSDGTCDIKTLAEACIKTGYSSLCLSDHSKTASYAGGLPVKRLLEQSEEIQRLNEELKPFRIFHGIESDILSNGDLDYPDDVLGKLDFVIGSVHFKLNMEREEATTRLLNAIKNPFLTILGHISGRLLLSREGYKYDEDAVFEALAKHHVVLEHNCNPYRLDPDWEAMKKAKRMGIKISLGPDAHDIAGFDDMKFGVMMARKAWLSKNDVLNTLSPEELDGFFKDK
ncbi:MAG: DNA polymerase/3'-5' exonuclease PolX [Spirochaetales bacterium]|nr:DNA polymerase/3'-5' exonuclease PolX [Spirochaetales bacterium]